MQGLAKVIEKFPEHAEIIIAFARLEKHLFFILDDEAHLLGCNLSTYAALGFSTYDEFLSAYGDDMSKLVEPVAGCVDVRVAGWIQGIETLRDHCIHIKDKKGELITCSMRVQSFALNGVVLHLLLIENQAVIEKAKKAHAYFESFKKQFLTNISHEFRTPMNNIIGFTELLKDTNLEKSQKEYLLNIDNSAHVMLGNIENLLELMQIETGSISAKIEPFKPFEELERLSNEYSLIAQNYNQQIFFIIDPHLPQLLYGDYEKIRRVLINLISNAIKYSKGANGKIIVEIKARFNNDRVMLEYSVSDNGIGISQDRLKTILRPFAASFDKHRIAQEGIGIGLNLSHKLLGVLDSQLKVKSQLGAGSRFSFEIMHSVIKKTPYSFVPNTKVCVWAEDQTSPMQLKVLESYLNKFEVEVMEVDGLAHQELTKAAAFFILTDYISQTRVNVIKTRYPNLQIIQVCHKSAKIKCEEIADMIEGFVVLPLLPHKIYDVLKVIWKQLPKNVFQHVAFKSLDSSLFAAKILVAEDNEINQRLLKTILEQKNYNVTTASNGQIAIDIYLKESFDLVLMDIDMPVLDGIAATRLMKEYDKKRGVFTPIIALTAHALLGDRERILSAGLDAHLAKPVEREFLLQVIDRYLSEKMSNKSLTDNFV
jgi:signal transduction histidine kinase/CheY-like chemotaxis protein